MSFTCYDKKIVVSGDIIEVYIYDKPIKIGYDKFNDRYVNKKVRTKTKEVIKENIDRSVRRTKQRIRNLINSNIDDNTSFLTLTFSENVTDVPMANKELKKFIQRLSYYYKKNDRELKYLGVIEFQDGKEYIDKNGEVKKGIGRGAIHYHILLFNAPYINFQKLANVWNNGFITINKIDDVDNVGAYVCKYMGKDIDDTRLKGKRRYFYSKNLTEPIIQKIDYDIDINEFYDKKKLAYSNFQNINTLEYTNTITYYQYNYKRENCLYEKYGRNEHSRKKYLYKNDEGK